MNRERMCFLISIWFVAAIATIAGFFGFFYPVLSIGLCLPVFFLFLIVFNYSKRLYSLTMLEYGLLCFLIVIWMSHVVQVFVPETGFDAVWYHLPVAKMIKNFHSFSYNPDLYQSINPLFSDAFFILGYQIFGEVGAKLVAFFFGSSLVLVSYNLARSYLERTWALLFLIHISLIQVIAWQSASFYVDLANAFWQMAFLISVLQVIVHIRQKIKQHDNSVELKWIIFLLVLAGIFFGASLATKLFSLILFPVAGWLVWFILNSYSNLKKEALFASMVVFMCFCLVVVVPFFVVSYFHTGDPLYSVTIHLRKLGQIGGDGSIFLYLLKKVLQFPLSFYWVVMTRDYVSPLLIFLLPSLFVFTQRREMNSPDWIIFMWGVSSFCLWWFVPPLSTRYATAGFICLLLIIFYVIQEFIKKKPRFNKMVFSLLVVGAIVLFLPRLLVNTRSLRYIITNQTKEAYLQQFMDGWIDPHLKSWHQI